MNILILGGYGSTGRLIAEHLLAQTKHKIVIAGRHFEKAQALVDTLADKRAAARQADASDSASLKAALRGVDFLLVAAPTTRYTLTVIRAALEAGVDYLDLQLSEEKLNILKAHAEEIKRKGGPVDWIAQDPVFTKFQQLGIGAKDSHPNAAKLFANFMFSEEGQKIIASFGRLPTRLGVATKVEGLDQLN